VGLIIYKSYNSNRNVEMGQMAYFIASVRENCIVRQKIWRGRRDANMTGGGANMTGGGGNKNAMHRCKPNLPRKWLKLCFSQRIMISAI
jgi:hypothetical protein